MVGSPDPLNIKRSTQLFYVKAWDEKNKKIPQIQNNRNIVITKFINISKSIFMHRFNGADERFN